MACALLSSLHTNHGAVFWIICKGLITHAGRPAGRAFLNVSLYERGNLFKHVNSSLKSRMQTGEDSTNPGNNDSETK